MFCTWVFCRLSYRHSRPPESLQSQKLHHVSSNKETNLCRLYAQDLLNGDNVSTSREPIWSHHWVRLWSKHEKQQDAKKYIKSIRRNEKWSLQDSNPQSKEKWKKNEKLSVQDSNPQSLNWHRFASDSDHIWSRSYTYDGPAGRGKLSPIAESGLVVPRAFIGPSLHLVSGGAIREIK